MKSKNQKTFNQLYLNIFRVLLAFIILFDFACCGTMQKDNIILEYSSGNDDIDRIRKEIKLHPTDESN